MTPKIKRRVLVKRKDLEMGEHASESSCPIALALVRQFREADCVMVHPREVVMLIGDEKWVGGLPAHAQRFVRRFDRRVQRGVGALPTRFDLVMRPEVVKRRPMSTEELSR